MSDVYHTEGVQLIWREFVLPAVERLRATRSLISWLEIGSRHGSSAVWTMENVLTGDQDLLSCVDVWHHKEDRLLFDEAVKHLVPRKLRIYSMTSRAFFCRGEWVADNSLAGVYIDGDHAASSVMEDAVLAWPKVAVGGVVVFDDYGWTHPLTKWSLRKVDPQVGIDGFVAAYQTKLAVLHRSRRQFIVQKRCE